MKISSKGRYAIRTLIDIAKTDKEFISIGSVATKQHISIKYLESIFAKLVKGKILISMRGSTGGYKLARKTTEITLKEILDSTGDGLELIICNDKNCPRIDSCESISLWAYLNDYINKFLSTLTLQDLIDKKYKDFKF